MKCQMERYNPVKIFWHRRNAFEAILFFRFNWNDRDKLYHLQNLTHAILSPTVGSFLTNGTASYFFDPVLPEEINCSICPKNPTRKCHANGKHSLFFFVFLHQILIH